MIDLHIHSNHSDGTWTPEEVVANAGGLGFSTIALTDHDNVSGLAEAIRAGAEKNIEVIPGIEITSYHRGVETHILGYFIDFEDSDFLKILKHLTDY
ncbi:MAG: PHP domain-containing protein, partial [bacterium]